MKGLLLIKVVKVFSFQLSRGISGFSRGISDFYVVFIIG